MFRKKAGFPPRPERRGFQPARSVKLCASVLFVLVGVFIAFMIRKGNVSEKVSKICAFILLLPAIGLFCASLNNFFLYIG